MIAIVFALILVAGFATQRGGICAVAATEALVRRGDAPAGVGQEL